MLKPAPVPLARRAVLHNQPCTPAGWRSLGSMPCIPCAANRPTQPCASVHGVSAPPQVGLPTAGRHGARVHPSHLNLLRQPSALPSGVPAASCGFWHFSLLLATFARVGQKLYYFDLSRRTAWHSAQRGSLPPGAQLVTERLAYWLNFGLPAVCCIISYSALPELPLHRATSTHQLEFS